MKYIVTKILSNQKMEILGKFDDFTMADIQAKIQSRLFKHNVYCIFNISDSIIRCIVYKGGEDCEY